MMTTLHVWFCAHMSVVAVVPAVVPAVVVIAYLFLVANFLLDLRD